MTVLLIEDEEAAAGRLEKLILKIEPEAIVLEHIDSVEAAIAWLDHKSHPDLIFMDIHLADGSSFEIFDHVQVNCPVIFTTAFDQYAIQAFRVSAVDYLLKPIKREELQAAFDKYRKRASSNAVDYSKLASSLKDEPYTRRFLIKIGQHIRMVDVSEAAYFYTENKITFLVDREGKRYPLDYSLEKLEEIVDPRHFFRVNRQMIIGLDAIVEMFAYSKSRVKVVLDPLTDTEVIVSTERSPHFKKWLVGKD